MNGDGERTIETTDDGFLVIPLPDHELDVWVCACERLKLGEEEGTCVMGRGPFVTVFEDEFSDLGNEGDVTVGGFGAERGAEEGKRGGHREVVGGGKERRGVGERVGVVIGV